MRRPYIRMEVKPGKPLGDIRAFVEKFKSHTEYGRIGAGTGRTGNTENRAIPRLWTQWTQGTCKPDKPMTE